MADYSAQRTMMVDTQIRPSDVTKFTVIEAMLAIPRERFVPDAARGAAYCDGAVNLGNDRQMLEPRVLAKMLDALDIRGDEMVLDLGCGLGYSSAVIARMAEAVVALEEDESLAHEAETLLGDIDADNSAVVIGPLTEGAAKHGPYDVIVLQGAVVVLPDEIAAQLKDGGRMAVIFQTGALGDCRIGYKRGGTLDWRSAFNATAAILPGFEKTPEFQL